MRIFDPHIHMTSRTTDDYERMYEAGVRALVEPAFWLGQPRTSVGSFVDYFDGLVGWEPFRAAQFGIRHHCTMALNPKEANDPRCRPVLELLPRYLEKDGVVAVGEVGYDSMTPEEDEVFAQQLALALEHDLPVLVHTPHRDKAEGTRRSLD
ncbi:MAG: TatD family hydrolase, partial [Actinomadura rubrobrunea]|nr:TatD family hydrolase [Actinomadura rubrobrunea]